MCAHSNSFMTSHVEQTPPSTAARRAPPRERGGSEAGSSGQEGLQGWWGITLSFSWELRSRRTCRYWNWRDGRLKIRSRRVDMPR